MATLVAPDHCDPFVDAEALRKACQGWGTDEKGIIEVICHRNAAQRKVIKETYEQQYSESLNKRLEDELSGDFERAVYRWMLEPFEREAVIANVALKKSDYKVIIELSCTASAEELLAIKRAYQLLLLLVSVHRHESEVTNPKLAEAEAEILHECIKDKKYNHDEVVRILTTRSKSQLVATFYQFRDAYGAPITKSLAGDKDQDSVSALHSVIRCIKSPIKYLERVVSHAMQTRGTDEDAITRVLVTRAEKDLAKIEELFYKRNSVTLEHSIAKETHGDYERFLLTILGKLHH
ncbi:hypothetical protein KSS87_005661 [Heliosperma pusillum]|nr:hypothetical protein KSS87_005661 [Heliosperma pusillum]